MVVTITIIIIVLKVLLRPRYGCFMSLLFLFDRFILNCTVFFAFLLSLLSRLQKKKKKTAFVFVVHKRLVLETIIHNIETFSCYFSSVHQECHL